MARSSRIYIIVSKRTNEPIAAFTVKYELVNYVHILEKNGDVKEDYVDDELLFYTGQDSPIDINSYKQVDWSFFNAKSK